MNDTPLFSVCVPCFNHGRYVGETLASVIAQDFTDFEIVVSDNASTDDSREIVRGFGDPRVRLLENRHNVGFAPNLQRVTAAARGRFVILLSSDDLMRPGALRRYAELFRQQGARADESVITSACDVIDSRGRVTGVKSRAGDSLRVVETPIERAHELRLDGSAHALGGREALLRILPAMTPAAVFCATAYARALWRRVEGYDTTYHYMPDTAFLHKLLALDPVFIYAHEPLFAYRVHAAGQSAQAAAQGALRQQVDAYMRTVNYPAEVLDSLGVSRAEIVRSFLDEFCFAESLRSLRAGGWTRALKLFAFAFATYPAQAARRPGTYAAGAALLAGPLGVAAARVAARTRAARNRGRGGSRLPVRQTAGHF